MRIPLRNSDEAYGLVSKAFHWAVAGLVLLQFIWAWRIQQLGFGRERFDLVNQHKSIGLTILGLVVLRLVWRYFNPPPPLPAGMPAWERRAAGITHGLFYVLLLIIPLAGWAMSSAAGYGASWFGLIHLPDPVEQNQALMDGLQWVHRLLAWLLAALVVVHVLAALRHHLVNKDAVMRRMLPW